MATEVKRRRGSDSDHQGFTGAVAELTVNTDDWTVHVHDGIGNYGYPLLRQDFNNVPTTAPFTNISLDTAIFDTGYSADGNEAQGTLYWNTDELTLSLVTNGETIELGQKVEVNVKNQTGSQINKGEVVYASGTVGASGRILVNKMKADGSIAAKRVLGVAAENIADGADGKVIQFGKLRKIDTTAFSNGDILWVSTSTAGAFQNTEPVQANGEIALPIAFVVYSSGASNGEIFVRVTPIDENEYQDYDAGLQDIAGLTPTNGNFIVGDGTNWVAESGNTARTSLGLGTGDSPTFSGLTINGSITVTGNVDGRDISDDGADLDELYTTIGLSSLTSNEVDQLENIGSTTISATQWGYLGVLDQNLRTTDAVTFSTVDTGQGANELYAMNQDVQTTDAVTFATVNTGQGDNELYAMNQDVQTTDDVTFNVIDVTDKIESANGYTSGITGAGTIYDMDDGNGSFFEVDNMRVRNELRAHIFKKDIVKASNAYLFITDAAEIAETSVIVDTTDTFRVLDGDDNATFNHGDLLWAKNIDDDASIQVTGVKIEVSVQPQFVWDTSEEVWNTSTITPNSYTEFASGTVSGGIHDGKTYTEYNIYEVTSGGTLNAGDTIVRVSDGSILNDASSQYSPFIDIYDGVETWADFQNVDKTKVRLGNLEGVSNASGYGLYTQNAFLTGALVVGDLTKVGQYMEFDGSTLTVQGNIVVQGGSGIASFTDAGAFATLDTATLSLISDAGNMAGIDSITAGNATTYIGAGAITTGLIAANTIVAGNIAAGTITATEIASNTITANEIDANTITASEIASNTITASEIFANTITASEIAAGTITATEIAAGTITANEIAAGTITANEIDVADLFAEDATIAGTLTIGSGTTIKLGELATASFGLEINTNNYWKLQTGVYLFKVGDANNFISFDTSSNVLDITTDNFDLATSTFVIDSDNNKIALGTSPDSITIAGTEAGFIANGSGEFKGYIDASNYIRLSSSALDIKAEKFYLKTGDIELSNSLNKQNSDITSSVTYSDTLQFAGLFFDSDNYLGHITDVDTSANSGYLFRVGGNTSNFIEVNEAGGVANINADTFKLEAGELVIDSSQGKKIAISDDNEEIIAIGDFDFGTEVVDTSTASASSSSTTATITDATPTNSDTNMDTGVGTLSSNVAENSPIVTLLRTYNVTGKWVRVQFDYEAPEYDNESFGERAVGFSITYFGNQILEQFRDEFDASAVTGSVDDTIFVPDTATFNTIQVQALGSEDGLSSGQAHGKINVSNLSVTVYDDTYTYTDIGNDGFRVYNSGGNKKIEFKDGNATATLDTLSIGSWDFELASNGNLLLKYEGSTVQTFTKP